MKLGRKIISSSSLLFALFLLFSGMTGYLLISSEPENKDMLYDIQEGFQQDESARNDRINSAEYDGEVNYARGSEMAEARKHYESSIEDYGIGSIYMPKADISVPLLAGTSEWNLFNGVATDSPDQQLGEGLFVGLSHNLINGTLLKDIDKMSESDLVYLTDFEDVYIYKTLDQKVVHETNGDYFEEPANDESPKLLLYRCEGSSGTDWRRVVYGEYIDKKPVSEVSDNILDGLQIDTELVDKSQSSAKDSTELKSLESNHDKDDGSLFIKIKNVLYSLRDKLAELISKKEYLRDYFLASYSLVDENTVIFGIVIVTLFLIYAIF